MTAPGIKRTFERNNPSAASARKSIETTFEIGRGQALGLNGFSSRRRSLIGGLHCLFAG